MLIGCKSLRHHLLRTLQIRDDDEKNFLIENYCKTFERSFALINEFSARSVLIDCESIHKYIPDLRKIIECIIIRLNKQNNFLHNFFFEFSLEFWNFVKCSWNVLTWNVQSKLNKTQIFDLKKYCVIFVNICYKVAND